MDDLTRSASYRGHGLEPAWVDQAVDLVLQGYPLGGVASHLRVRVGLLRRVIDARVAGGPDAVSRRLMGRLRRWLRSRPGVPLAHAEAPLGIPLENLERLARELTYGWGEAADATGLERFAAWLALHPDESLDVAERDLALPQGGAHRMLESLGVVSGSASKERLTDLMLTTDDPGILPRAYQMARRYALGETLEQIGASYGLTRERVRQLINRDTPWSVPWIGAARKRARAELEATDRRRVARWSADHPGAAVSQAVDDLGLPDDEVRRLLGRRLGRHERVPRTWGPQRRLDDDLLADLRAFHAQTGKTTASSYATWAKAAGVPGPQTVAIRFGSWNSATTRAGINDAPPIERARRHCDEDLWAAVVQAARMGLMTHQEVSQWLAQVPGSPSSALIRQRLALRWGELVDEALRVVRGESTRDPAWVAAVSATRDWSTFLPPSDPHDHDDDGHETLEPARGCSTSVRADGWASAAVVPRADDGRAELAATVGCG